MNLGELRTHLAKALVALAVGSVLVAAGPAMAGAQVDCDDPAEAGIATGCVTTTTGDPGTTTVLPAPPTEDPVTRAPVESQGLAFTGADLAGLAAIGAGAAAVGISLTVAGRRRAARLSVSTSRNP